MKTIELKITGMSCPSCSASVENLVEQLRGIVSKHIDYKSGIGKITFSEHIVSEKEIITIINKGHYKVKDNETFYTVKNTSLCPQCKQQGRLVPNTVFKSNLKSSSLNKIKPNANNYICMNPDCNIAYYNASNNSFIDKSELKRELWFKKGTKRKIICYCNNIDTEMIKNAVKNNYLETWEEITSYYRKKVIEKCEIINPVGICCREQFKKVVAQINS
jgi:copper chaperone CopZ